MQIYTNFPTDIEFVLFNNKNETNQKNTICP